MAMVVSMQSTLLTPPPPQLSPSPFFGGRPLHFSFRPVPLSSSSSSRLLKVDARQPTTPTTAAAAAAPTPEISRKDFPSDFMFGAGCSCFQVEGNPTSGGRGNTNWDSFVHLPGKISNGDVNYPGCDFYNLYEEDIQLAKKLGFDSFRFSISWTRIYPHGAGEESNEGIAFYNKVINAVIKAGLTPLATLFHWEVPQYLDNDPDILGFRTKNIVPYFVKLAETCFKHFGDRVKHWATVNEMWTFAAHGYAHGVMAPGRCSSVSGSICYAGDSQTEPYEVGHNLLLAHAKVYRLYTNKYKPHQHGFCGFNPCHFGVEPYSDSWNDIHATERYLEFFTGWQVDPVVFGDYPKSMRDALGDRLPKFTKEESEELKNSVDFLGHNYYTAKVIKHADVPKDPSLRWFDNDGGNEEAKTTSNGEYIGALMGPADSWIRNCPGHLTKLLVWMEKRYGNIECYITENGVMDEDPYAANEVAINDKQRCTFIKDHLTELSKAITDKEINVKGYFYWSFIDVFEWNTGYAPRYGLVRVDFEKGQPPTRTVKASGEWFRGFLSS